MSVSFRQMKDLIQDRGWYRKDSIICEQHTLEQGVPFRDTTVPNGKTYSRGVSQLVLLFEEVDDCRDGVVTSSQLRETLEHLDGYMCPHLRTTHPHVFQSLLEGHRL
jgi:hypothetical protein